MFTNIRSGSLSASSENFSLSQLLNSAKSLVHRQPLLATCVIIILSVSTLDTYLVYSLKHVIVEFERNPICLALIEKDPQNLSLFICGKLLGNLGVVGVLFFLFRYSYRNRNLVAMSVAGFQILLTFYLCFADPSSGVLDFDGLGSNSPKIHRRSLDSLLIHLAAGAAIAAAFSVIYRIRNPRLILRKRDSQTAARQFFGILR